MAKNFYDNPPESVEAYLNGKGYRSISEQEQIIEHAKMHNEDGIPLSLDTTVSQKIKILLKKGLEDFEKVMEDAEEFLVEY